MMQKSATQWEEVMVEKEMLILTIQMKVWELDEDDEKAADGMKTLSEGLVFK